MSDGHSLFAFVLVGGLGRALDDFAEADATSSNADFVWVHLDLSDPAGSSSPRTWSTGICVTSARSPVPSPCKQVRFASSPRGDYLSPVDVFRCAPSRRCEAGSKRRPSFPKARSD